MGRPSALAVRADSRAGETASTGRFGGVLLGVLAVVAVLLLAPDEIAFAGLAAAAAVVTAARLSLYLRWERAHGVRLWREARGWWGRPHLVQTHG